MGRYSQCKKKRTTQTKETQSYQPSRKNNSSPIFDEASIFEDIMDERRAEGKGYGGSK